MNNSNHKKAASQPLVSIALCTYNGAKFLRPQIESLLNQTHSNLEILVADDLSTDDTANIVADYAARDSRINFSVNERNLGFKRNFERLISRCEGEFIAPSDQDDIWKENKIEKMLAKIGNHSMAFSDSEFVDAIGGPFGLRVSQRIDMQDIFDPLSLVVNNCVSGHAMVFTRELLKRALPFAEEFEFHDWWLAISAAALSGVVYVPEPLVGYRIHSGNVTDILGINYKTSESQNAIRNKAEEIRAIGRRLSALARVYDREHHLINELSAAWNGRENQWLSPKLGFLMVKHGGRLKRDGRSDAHKLHWRFIRYAIGLQTKRFLKWPGYV